MREHPTSTNPDGSRALGDSGSAELVSTKPGNPASDMPGTDEPIDVEARGELERLHAYFGIINDAPPRVIGDRYQIEHVIARGGMGVVYLATDTKLKRVVALKLIVSQPFASTEQLRARLRLEAQSLARVEHTHVVPIYDVGMHRGELYLAMRYIEGTTLRMWQQVERRSLREIVSVYTQAGRGLAAAHRAKLVHRDFKPDNVLVDRSNTAYVGDFGVAASLAAPQSVLASGGRGFPSTEAETPSGRLTRAGQLIGTLPYMAKEQLFDAEVDARADQFGFCVALWEACAGTLPFQANGVEQMLTAIKQGPRGGDQLPKWLARVLSRGLSPQREHRFADMPELIVELERGLARPSRRRWAAGTSLVIILLILPWMRERPGAEQPSCESFSASVTTHWNPERRERLTTRASEEPAMTRYASSTLDALTELWTRDAQALCSEGHAPRPSETSRACMDRWLGMLEQRVVFLTENQDPMALTSAPELLLQLSVPHADYCAVVDGTIVDREVWESSQLAHIYARVGDFDRARGHAEAALTRARALAEGKFSAELATAEFAMAALLARLREPSFASRFFSAQAHAVASRQDRLQLEILLLWTKSTALRFDETSLEEAKNYLKLVEPYLVRAGLSEQTLYRADHLEARGIVARAHGVVHNSAEYHREAIELHRTAAELFTTQERPDLAARALNNVGANLQNLGELDEALATYVDALKLLSAAALPPSYPTLVDTQLNLANVFIERGSEGPELPHVLAVLGSVIDHGGSRDRIRALQFRCQLAIDTAEFSKGVPFARQALTALESGPVVSERLAATLGIVAAFVLAGADEQGAWAQLSERIARMRPHDELEWLIFQTWQTEMLEQRQRCSEAEAVVQVVRAHARTHPTLVAWLEERPGHACAS
jgi:serine/threonine protein kinase